MPDKILFEFSEKGLQEIDNRLRAIEESMKVSGTKGKQAFTAIEGSVAKLTQDLKALKIQQQTTTVAGSKEWNSLGQTIRKQEIELNNFKNQMKTTGTLSQGVAKGMKDSFISLAGALGLAYSAGQIKSFLTESVKAYQEQLKNENSLTQALGRRSQALIDQASALQYVVNIGDEEILRGQGLLAMFGLTEKQILNLTPAMLNFAKAQGVDVSVAAKLLSKTIGSSTNALSRYGIEITGAVGSNERLESALTALNNKFGGQAEAMAKAEGDIVGVTLALGDMKEEIGKLIIESDGASSSIKKLIIDATEGLKEMNTEGTTANKVWKGFLSGLKDMNIFVTWYNSLKNITTIFDGFKTNFVDGIKHMGKVVADTFTFGQASALKDWIMGLGIDFEKAGNKIEATALKIKKAYIENQIERMKANKDYDYSVSIKAREKELESINKQIEKTKELTKIEKTELHKKLVEQEKEYNQSYYDKIKNSRETEKELTEAEKEEIKKREEERKKALAQAIKDREEEIKKIKELITFEYELDEESRKRIELKKQEIKLLKEQQYAEQENLNNIQKKYENDRMLENASFKNKRSALETWYDTEFELRKGNQEQLDALDREYSDKKRDIDKDELSAKKEFNDTIKEQAVNSAQSVADALFEIDRIKNEKIYSDKIKNLEAQKERGLITEEEFNARKEALDKREFEKNKKQAKKQALINSAIAVTKTLATIPFPTAIPFLAALAIETAAQIAVINAQKFAKGKIDIRGGVEGKDSIPALLTPRESVINVKGTMKYPTVLQAINDDRLDEHLTKVYLPKIIAKKKGGDFAENLANVLNNSNIFDDYRLYKETKRGNKLSEINTDRLIKAIEKQNKKRLWSN